MKVVASQVALAAQHHAEHVKVVSERWTWQSGRSSRAEAMAAPASSTPDPMVQSVSRQAQGAPDDVSEASEAGVVSGNLSPRLLALRDMLERLTGEVIRLYGEDVREAPAGSAKGEGVLRLSQAPVASEVSVREAGGNGPSWSYERDELRHESESSDFAARGQVHTADGRTVSFELSLSMQRSVTEASSVRLRGGAVQQQDPLVIHFDGSAAQLQDQRFSFDLNADGRVEQVALLSGDRGYLALDRNGNGRVDDGTELFGPQTGQGFAELAQWDEDGNHWIDEADAVFQRLQVWMPQVEGASALQSLSTVGVGALYLGAVATPFELKGSDQQSLGTVRSSSVYLHESGAAGTVQQIDLTV